MALGSRSPWGYLRKNKNSFRHGPGESESLGYLGKNKIASVMALGSRSPWDTSESNYGLTNRRGTIAMASTSDKP